MPLFALHCTDGPGKLASRLAVRPEHLAYVAGFGAAVRVAGPLLGDDGSTFQGSFFLLDMNDRAEAEAFSANDPYVKAGVFGSVALHVFRWTINPPSDLA